MDGIPSGINFTKSGSAREGAEALSTLGSGVYVGALDPLVGTTITGWAISQTVPFEPVHLRAFIDGEAIATIRCDGARAELGKLGLPGDMGGFALDIPKKLLDGKTHTLSILFDDDAPLTFRNADGQIRTNLRFTPESGFAIQGFIDGLHGNTVRGWAVRRNLRSGETEGGLRVQIIWNDACIGEVTANYPRLDVARELNCSPEVGFVFALPVQYRNGHECELAVKALPEGEVLAGSPVSVTPRPSKTGDDLRALSETLANLCAAAFKLQQQLRDASPVPEATVLDYDRWARGNLARLRAKILSAEPLEENAPLVSVIMPTYRTNIAHLSAAIESVRAQTYTNWELIIADDGSGERALTALLRQYALLDERIIVVRNRENRGIAAATNSGLRRAHGAWVALFDHDDLLVDVALEVMVRAALRTGATMLYSDEDKIDEFGVLSEPNLKPDWNYRLLLSVNYVCHLVMIERRLLRRTGMLRSECDGAQDHDLLLRLAEVCPPERIMHVPEVLYHWRKSATSTAASGSAKPYTIEAGRRAIEDHLRRRGFLRAEVFPQGESTTYRTAWRFTDQPSVTIIVPFKDQIATTRRCLDRLRAHTHWENWRVVLVDNGSVTPEAVEFCREAVGDPHVVVRRVDEPFNYSQLNNLAAREHPADFYVFLNNDVFLTQDDWLRVLIDEALADPKAGIVGAKLLYPDGTVQHGGVVLGVGGIADHAFRGIPGDHGGYLYRANCAQHYSAVTAACMLCRADLFMEVGGFDQQELAVAFNDVDLCLKAGKQGWRVVWTPALVAEHHESLSRGDDISAGKANRFFYESHIMLERWHEVLPADPHYNPHFSRQGGLFMELR